MPEIKVENPICITTHEVENYPDTLLLEISKYDFERLMAEIKKYPKLFNLFGDIGYRKQDNAKK